MKNIVNTSRIALIFVLTLVIVFTVTMTVVFVVCGDVPNTLITCFFMAVTGEVSILGWIRTAKLRYPVNNNIVTTTLEEIEENDLGEMNLGENNLENNNITGGDEDEGFISTTEPNIYSNRSSHRGD